MQISIYQEESGDFLQIFKLVEKAFATEKYSDHKEQFLVERLHQAKTYIPKLSLVAKTKEGRIVGYSLMTEVQIVSETGTKVPSFALAPLAVLPSFQKQGIGTLLIKKAHQIAADIGYGSVVVLGHKDYYPRFGYKKADEFGIKFPFDVSPEFCMVKELTLHALDGVNGTVCYPEVFFA